MIEADSLHELLRQSHYRPLDRQELARKLKVRPSDEPAFAALLDAEEKAGRVVKAKGLYNLPERLGLVAGRLSVNERGFGFLIPEDPDHPDVFIGAEEMGIALHQDRVLVRVNTPAGRGGGFGKGGGKPIKKGGPGSDRISGQVVRVLLRARTKLVGSYERTGAIHFVRPDDVRLMHDVVVPAPRQAIPPGHKVVVQLKEWTTPGANPEGEIVEVLGAADKPGVDLLAIIRKYELPGEFPAAVLAEADRIPDTVQPSDLAGREDFRKDFVITIDPDDAKDFDDALSYKILPDGELEVAIHIADVSHYVRPGTALDAEARIRGNSVYLVDRVIPMLPEKLSNGLCSLRPDVDRLVKSVVVRLGPGGRAGTVRFTPGVIHSRLRLTYQEAYAQLLKPVGLVGRHLKVLGDMAMALRRARFAQGALNLEFPEVKVRLDADGRPVRLEKVENDASHQLIEEYMLLANETVARQLRQTGQPALYRVHENPEPQRLNDFRVQILTLGIEVGDLTQRGEIQKLLARISGTPEEPVLKTNLLKSMKRAVYSEKPLGHFGLAKHNYTHFTSPIRRYADLAVHRALFGKAMPLPSGLAEALSATERKASEAEVESVRLKKLEYFALQARETEGAKKQVFQALVLEVKSGGLLVELPDFLVTGFVRIAEMRGDFYSYDGARQELRGEETRVKILTGMRIGVHVVEVNLDRRQVDFGTARETLLPPGTAQPARRPLSGKPTGRAPQRESRPATHPAKRSGERSGKKFEPRSEKRSEPRSEQRPDRGPEKKKSHPPQAAKPPGRGPRPNSGSSSKSSPNSKRRRR